MASRKEITVDFLNQSSEDTLDGALGVKMLTLEEGRLTGRMQIEQKHLAINGFLHAASIIALADTCCGNAAMAHLPEGAKSFTTIEMKSNHIGTARKGAILCTATACHLGKTTQVWDAVVTEEESGKTIALFRSTLLVLWSA